MQVQKKTQQFVGAQQVVAVVRRPVRCGSFKKGVENQKAAAGPQSLRDLWNQATLQKIHIDNEVVSRWRDVELVEVRAYRADILVGAGKLPPL